jgi:hypothetical protein
MKCSASEVARGFAMHQQPSLGHLRAEARGKKHANELHFGIARQFGDVFGRKRSLSISPNRRPTHGLSSLAGRAPALWGCARSHPHTRDSALLPRTVLSR